MLLAKRLMRNVPLGTPPVAPSYKLYASWSLTGATWLLGCWTYTPGVSVVPSWQYDSESSKFYDALAFSSDGNSIVVVQEYTGPTPGIASETAIVNRDGTSATVTVLGYDYDDVVPGYPIDPWYAVTNNGNIVFTTKITGMKLDGSFLTTVVKLTKSVDPITSAITYTESDLAGTEALTDNAFVSYCSANGDTLIVWYRPNSGIDEGLYVVRGGTATKFANGTADIYSLSANGVYAAGSQTVDGVFHYGYWNTVTYEFTPTTDGAIVDIANDGTYLVGLPGDTTPPDYRPKSRLYRNGSAVSTQQNLDLWYANGFSATPLTGKRELAMDGKVYAGANKYVGAFFSLPITDYAFYNGTTSENLSALVSAEVLAYDYFHVIGLY